MTKPDDLGQQLIDATRQYLARAAPLLRQAGRATPRVQVQLDLRGQAAGQLRRYPDGRLLIRYNLALAEHQPDAFLAETVPHEVAHVVTHLCHGRVRPHGPEWQRVMRWFGIAQPRRCHDFAADTSARRQRRWRYQCACRGHELTTTRHNRVQRGTRYHCRACGTVLERSGH